MNSQDLAANKRIARVRAELGTAWHHQGRLRGVGLDCIGLMLVAEPKYADYDLSGYGRDPADGVLEQILDHILPPGIPPGAPGDLLLFEHPGSGRQHLALNSGENPPMMIHAQAGGRGAGKVCEVRIDEAWLRMLKKVYRWES